MVILIGGSSHVGKTLLSKKLIEKYNFPCTSIDHIKMGFVRSGITDLTPSSDYEMRYFLWPFLREMIKTAIENKQDLILEGCYIPSEWKRDMDAKYLKDIRCVFIVMSEKYIRSHENDLIKYADVVEKRVNDEVNIDRLVNCSYEFKEECIKEGVPYYEIDDVFDLSPLMDMERYRVI